MNKSKKTTQKEESKQRILNVAARLFRRQGFKATGVDQLMGEAGLTAGAFYAHFRSKEDLFEQTLARALEDSKKLLLKNTDHLQGDKKNKAIFERYCSEAHRDFPDKGCVLPALASEIGKGTKQSKIMVANYIEKWAEFICEHLSENISREQRRVLALQMISRSVGAIILSRVVGGALSKDILDSAREVDLDLSLN